MKRGVIVFLFLCMIFMFSITASADDAVLGGSGKTVYPVTSSDIRMVSEKVDMRVDFDKTMITCEFVFKNEGEYSEIEMGFPENLELREGWPDNGGIYDFKAWVNNVPSKVIKKKGGKPEQNELGELEYPFWHTFKVKFKKNESLKVKNTYWVYNGYDSSGGWRINYVLKTGSVWKGTIGKADINMTIVGYMPYFELMLQEEQSYMPASFSPYGAASWHMENLEPDKDINIYYKPTYDRHVRNRNVSCDSFWDRFLAMDYKNAAMYIAALEKAAKSPDGEGFADNVNLAVGATYYYNKEYSKALSYFDKYDEDNIAAMYYKALIYKNSKDYKKMKACLDKLLEQSRNEYGAIAPMKAWVNTKYKEYGKYF